MSRSLLTRPVLTVSALVLGLLASGIMMLAASYAAFKSTTTNSNTWSAGSVALTDDDSASLMFTTGAVSGGAVSGAALTPSQSIVNCITVTYTGVNSTVALYATGVSGVVGVSTGLLAYLHVKVEEGTGGPFGDCSSFVAGATIWGGVIHPGAASDLLTDFPSAFATGAASALASWVSGSSRAYRFTITLDAATPGTSQGATAAATFTWEAQNS